jgi:GTP pyrophosphokinase
MENFNLDRHSPSEQNLIHEALVLANVFCEGKITPNGESCFAQGLAMGEVLDKLKVDATTLAAAIIYSAKKYTELNFEDVTEHLGDTVTKLVSGTLQMDSVSELYREAAEKKQHEHNIDNIRKMLLAMVDDIRIVLIKIAEKLYILRCAFNFSKEDRKKIAAEIAAIYAPLANRLGIVFVKKELEDLVFHCLEPEKYNEIFNALKQTKNEREKYIAEVIGTIENILTKADIKGFKVSGRAKHIYSIYLKMQRKKVEFKDIYDVSAVRVLVPAIPDCYNVLSLIHANFAHIQNEFDDYISNPKPNGYCSIHTAVLGPENRNVEIQIRTYEMHQQSELGIAAHWMYKEGGTQKTGYEQKIAWLRQVMDWQKEVTKDSKVIEQIRQIFHDSIYVFTPTGDVLEFPRESTPLDFAYHIHSSVGHRCIGAKVNGNIVPLTYHLKTGDRIEILTAKEGKPKRDWANASLGFLKTSRARSKVMSWFKKEDYPQKEQKEKNEKVEKSEKKTEIETQKAILPKVSRKTRSSHDIDIHGIDNLLTRIASCCKPIPGDTIIGYITQNSGISIHRKDCYNVTRAINEKPERFIVVSWDKETQQKYTAKINIKAYDRHGLVRDITAILADANIMVLGLNLTSDVKENLAYIDLSIEIENVTVLNNVLTKIHNVTNVISVKRRD